MSLTLFFLFLAFFFFCPYISFATVERSISETDQGRIGGAMHERLKAWKANTTLEELMQLESGLVSDI